VGARPAAHGRGLKASTAAPRPRLLVLGSYAPGTGFTRVLEALVENAAQQWEVHWVGVSYEGEPVGVRGAHLYPVIPGGGDVFGAFRACEVALAVRPAAVVVLHDIWHLGRYARTLRPKIGGARLLAYFPLDGRLRDGTLVAPLAAFDGLATYTAGARADLLAAAAGLGDGAGLPPVAIVPHGVDSAVFRPLPALAEGGFERAARRGATARVFPHLAASEHPFVVLNPGRPAQRKRMDLTLEGFALFARDKPPGVRLCLHQAISDASHREKALDGARALGIADRLELDPLGSRRLDDDELNLLYNACDVGLSTSMGEGWGLATWEHAAAGGAQVVPDHSACGELWRGRAELVPLSRRVVPWFSPLEMGEVEAAAVAAALERLYGSPDLLRERCRQAYTWASLPAHGWGAAAASFLAWLGQQA